MVPHSSAHTCPQSCSFMLSEPDLHRLLHLYHHALVLLPRYFLHTSLRPLPHVRGTGAHGPRLRACADDQAILRPTHKGFHTGKPAHVPPLRGSLAFRTKSKCPGMDPGPLGIGSWLWPLSLHATRTEHRASLWGTSSQRLCRLCWMLSYPSYSFCSAKSRWWLF